MDDKIKNQLISARDQAWASLGDCYNEIDRITDNGPDDTDDIKIIMRCMHAVRGDLILRRDGLIV